MSTTPKPNDDRSTTKNPNNPAHEADRQNREKLGHPAPAPSPQGGGGQKK